MRVFERKLAFLQIENEKVRDRAGAQLAREDEGEIEAKAYKQNACFEGALLFARTEGIVPAPESSHALRAAIDEAMLAKEEGKEKTILFGLSGHGQLDMMAYDAYLSGKLEDYEYPEESIRQSLERLPKVCL